MRRALLTQCRAQFTLRYVNKGKLDHIVSIDSIYQKLRSKGAGLEGEPGPARVTERLAVAAEAVERAGRLRLGRR